MAQARAATAISSRMLDSGLDWPFLGFCFVDLLPVDGPVDTPVKNFHISQTAKGFTTTLGGLSAALPSKLSSHLQSTSSVTDDLTKLRLAVFYILCVSIWGMP